MQLRIRHKLREELVLPINYHHILQSMIYRNMESDKGYSSYVHDAGYRYCKRQFKLFTFSLLQGRYEIREKCIVFREEVSFEVRSPDIFMLRILEENIRKNGLTYGERHFSDIELSLLDRTVEQEVIAIKMESPVCVYSTDEYSGKTHFFMPKEEQFRQLVNDNFMRKYEACYGVKPESGIRIEAIHVTDKDKYVTRYKNFYISGWKGEYYLAGKRKYLDFLYQTGLGSKNSQGFGLFEIMDTKI